MKGIFTRGEAIGRFEILLLQVRNGLLANLWQKTSYGQFRQNLKSHLSRALNHSDLYFHTIEIHLLAYMAREICTKPTKNFMASHFPQQRWLSRLYSSQLKLALNLVIQNGCKAEWPSGLGYILRWYTHPNMVTHPSTNRAQCKVTSQLRRRTLPLWPSNICLQRVKWTFNDNPTITTGCYSTF